MHMSEDPFTCWLGRDEGHQKDKLSRLPVYTCTGISLARSGIHLQSKTFLQYLLVATIASSPTRRCRMCCSLWSWRRFFSSVPRPEIPCSRCRVMQSAHRRASRRLRVGTSREHSRRDSQIIRPISSDVSLLSSYTSLLSSKFFRRFVRSFTALSSIDYLRTST